MSGAPSNRAQRRALGIGVGTWETGRAFRRPSSRVRAHRVPFDPIPAQRPSSRRHGRTRYGQERDLAAARRIGTSVRGVLEAAGKFRPSLEELRETLARATPDVQRLSG